MDIEKEKKEIKIDLKEKSIDELLEQKYKELCQKVIEDLKKEKEDDKKLKKIQKNQDKEPISFFFERTF